MELSIEGVVDGTNGSKLLSGIADFVVVILDLMKQTTHSSREQNQ